MINLWGPYNNTTIIQCIMNYISGYSTISIQDHVDKSFYTHWPIPTFQGRKNFTNHLEHLAIAAISKQSEWKISVNGD